MDTMWPVRAASRGLGLPTVPAVRREQGAGEPSARRLLRAVLVRQRATVGVSVAAGLVWQAAGIAVPWVLERAIDTGLVERDRAAIVRWCLLLVGLGAIAWSTDAARHWYVERAGAEGGADVRQRLTRRVLAMTDDEVAAVGHGDVGARLVADSWTVWMWLSGVATLVTSSFTLVAVSVVLLWSDPALAAIGLAAIPVAAALALGSARRHRRYTAAAAGAAGRYGAAAEAALTGARTIKGLGAERRAADAVAIASARLTVTSLRAERLEAWWVSSATAIPTAAIALGVWFGGQRVLDGTTTVGALLAFVAWMGQLVTATTTLTHRLASRGAALAAAARIAHLLGPDLGSGPAAADPAADVAAPPSRPPTTGHPTAVSCHRVDVRRGARRVLVGVDLELPRGSWTALVGPIGGGKSSLLRVLAGLDRPAAGFARVAGADPARIGPAARRARLVLVPQGPLLVSGPVGEVVRAGAAGVDDDDDDVWAALDAVDCRELAERLGGLHGAITDRGMGLSGGQRQRVALAAAALGRPEVLLLDDPTSALDEATEARVLRGLRDLLPRTTVVVATHRAATAAACDRVLTVRDRGVHDAADGRTVAWELEPARPQVEAQ